MQDASVRPDRGVQSIMQLHGDRPSAVYCRNVSSLETAAMEIDAVARLNLRTASAVRHDVISFNEDESRTLTDEQAIEFTRRVYDHRGYGRHAQIFAVHRDTITPEGAPVSPEGPGNLHVHVMTACVNARDLKPLAFAGDHALMHKATRQAEVEMGLAHDRGLWVVDDTTRELRPSTRSERQAWKIEREEERFERLARSYVSRDGIETYQDRADKINRAMLTYFDDCKARGETPLNADLYRIAAEHAARLEPREEGPADVRMMQREGESVRPTDTVLPLEQIRVNGALFPSATKAERDLVNAIMNDPGRVSRDIVHAGKATFTREDIDGYFADRLSKSEQISTLSAYVQTQDKTLVGLSLDTTFPLYTTKAHQEATQRLFDRFSEMARTADPHFSRSALNEAIQRVELEKGYTLSDEQRVACDMLRNRAFCIEGNAGSGKTSTVADVARVYGELTGRPVEGFSTTSAASEQLGKSAQIPVQNTARAIAVAERKGEDTFTKRNSIVVFDEVSAASFERANRLLESAQRTGSQIGFIGDRAQLQSPSAGDVFGVVVDAAKREKQYTMITAVHRQQGAEVSWMREKIPVLEAAIRDGNAAQAYKVFGEFYDRHAVYCEDRKAEVTAKAAQIASSIRQGESALAPTQSRDMALFTNRAVRAELGLSSPQKHQMANGVRDFAVGDRVVFERNDAELGVFNGYMGTVRTAAGTRMSVDLDSGRTVALDVAKYKALDWGYSTTSFKSQGGSDPHDVAAIGKADTARSALVAFTRAQDTLKIYTQMTKDEFCESLTSVRAMRAPSDALLFEKIVRETGGPDSGWAIAMHRAQANAADPLRRQHAAFLAQRQDDLRQTQSAIHERYAEDVEGRPDRRQSAGKERDQELRTAMDACRPLTFTQWGIQERTKIEHGEQRREKVADIQSYRRERSPEALQRKADEIWLADMHRMLAEHGRPPISDEQLLQARHNERQNAADLEQRRSHEREIEQQQPERKRGRRM